jgi:two-component system, cell cycle response regulator
MSLRLKLMAALLATGLATVAIVGGLSYMGLTHRVDEIRREQASEHFRGAMTAYFGKYGDWASANRAEPFDRFVQRLQGERGEPPPPRLRPALLGTDGPPPGHPPPPPGGEPPFRFVLADADYRVLLGAGIFEPGEALPADIRNTTHPITVSGRTVAHVVSEGLFIPSSQDHAYLNAMRSSLLAGGLAAVIVATGLGLLLSGGLSRRLQGLTGAIRAMHGGALQQQVPAEGKDEVALLARAFNDMSTRLAASHAELQESNRKVLEQAAQLRELSVRDALTQLYNRRHFDEQASTLFKQAMRHKRPLSLVIADIDYFKRINDQYTHAVGDAVLRQIGEILRTHMRLSDLVARYGGEEFVLALPETGGPQARALCDKLRGLIESYPWNTLHTELRVTMSMGVCSDLAAGSADAMLRKADVLLYRAKEAGRNRVCHI